jgi:hypothetical protein
MMAAIFGSAARVLVWLGTSEPLDALAFATAYASTHFDGEMSDAEGSEVEGVFDVAEAVQAADLELETIDGKLQEHPQCMCCGDEFIVGSRPRAGGLAAIESLTARPWFKRL